MALSGIKSMEHGALGEARAKAFLLERFWVLERSVDVQGADYLIQRRLTDQNFMDRSPPKLGVVQVKYVQDGDTYISINKDYTCDGDGRTYSEFFLLIFTGRESNSRSFLLSSNDLLTDSKETTKGGKTYLKIKASQVLGSSNYEILVLTKALDRIDHALRNADFLLNRQFLSSTNYVNISQDHIDHDFLLPLDNHYADIGKAFYEEKKKLQRIKLDVEDIVDAMGNILTSTDPEAAFLIYEDVISEHIGSGHGIVINADFFNDVDFLYAIQNHKQRLTAIRKLGLEGSYFALLNKLESEIPTKVAQLKPTKHQKIRISVAYDPGTLANARLTIKSLDKEVETPYLVSSTAGRHVIMFSPYSWLPYDVRAGKIKVPSTIEKLEQLYRESSWKFRRPFQSEIEKYLIGEEVALGW